MLTVLLSTRNRAQILQEVLRAYCRLEMPSGGWKVVIVDNGSTDETSKVVASFLEHLPLRSITEPKLGKSQALNAGLALVEGDLVVLTDDDVFPCADWLVQLRKAADTHEEYAILGGTVLPRWGVTPSAWVEWVERGPVFTLTDPSQRDGPISPNLIFGPNMAIRTSIFQSGNRFDTSIGPSGPDYAMGSETELLMRLGRQGHRSMFVSSAKVEHLIRTEQLNKRWVFKRAIRYGRGYYRLFQADDVRMKKSWMGLPLYIFRDIPKEGVFALWALMRGNEEIHFRSRWRFSLLCGCAIEARAVTRSQKEAKRLSSFEHLSGKIGAKGP